MLFFDELAKSFLILFIIMDPFASLPVFLSLTKGLSRKKMAENAAHAVLVAALLMYAFLFFGNSILGLFKVSFSSFQIAGGIVLLLMSLEIILGLKLGGSSRKSHAAVVIIATPMLTGPGVITTVTILTAEVGQLVTAVAGFLALLGAWLVLKNAEAIRRRLGEETIEALSKIIGLLLAAVAVEFIRAGVGAA